MFLIAADHSGSDGSNRESVYTEWAAERLERDNALLRSKYPLGRVSTRTSIAEKHRGQRQVSAAACSTHGAPPRRAYSWGIPESFNAMLAGGIGRHVAFGYGMVLLRPPS